MKKIDRFFKQLDHFIEAHSSRFVQFIKQYSIFFTIIFVVMLGLVLLLRMFLDTSQERAFVIDQDLNQLAAILTSIDKECNILSIINNRGLLNFFTVQKFVGSQVGCLNLAYPARWKGPYLKSNPLIQGAFYEIIKTKEGLFIVPGSGVQLPNGIIMGDSFIVNEKTSLDQALQLGGPLRFGNTLLALKLSFTLGDWDGKFFSSAQVDKAAALTRTFEEALPPT